MPFPQQCVYAAKLGYDWVMRFDDDSYMLSEVPYDMFGFMAKMQYRYGYRVDCWEPASLCENFRETVEQYMVDHQLSSPLYRGLTNCKPRHYPGYYNNWFVTDLQFWLSDPVQEFLRFIDETGNIYLRRWNDLVIQAAAIQLFLRPSQVYKFTDWTYQHASTNKDSTLGWGGVVVEDHFMADGVQKMGLAQTDGRMDVERVIERCLTNAITRDTFGRGMRQLIGFADQEICEGQTTIKRCAAERVGLACCDAFGGCGRV